MLLVVTNEAVRDPACIPYTRLQWGKMCEQRQTRVIKCHSLRGARESAVEKIDDAREKEKVTRMSQKKVVKLSSKSRTQRCRKMREIIGDEIK